MADDHSLLDFYIPFFVAIVITILLIMEAGPEERRRLRRQALAMEENGNDFNNIPSNDSRNNSPPTSSGLVNRPYTGPPLDFAKMTIKGIIDADPYIVVVFYRPADLDSTRVTEQSQGWDSSEEPTTMSCSNFGRMVLMTRNGPYTTVTFFKPRGNKQGSNETEPTADNSGRHDDEFYRDARIRNAMRFRANPRSPGPVRYTGPPLELDTMRIRTIVENERYIHVAFYKD